MDSARRGAKFNKGLTPEEVEENEGWRTAVDDLLLLVFAGGSVGQSWPRTVS
ncbi:MAG: hypothetical protein AABX13_05420 [Nanoarchaeota archaeon]